jgi:hypothetical protein
VIIRQDIYEWITTLLIAGLAVGWGIVDIVRLRAALREDTRDAVVRDRIFGSLIGLTIAVLGIIVVVRYHA